MTAADWTRRQQSDYCKSNESETSRDGGENSPIYHELDPVVVAAEPPLSSFHAYQSIVDVHRELFQLRSSGSANSFDVAAASDSCTVTQSPSCGDVAGHVTTTPTSGSMWTLFSRLRLPRRTTATSRQRQGHVISPSGRTSLSPPHSAPSVAGTPTPRRGETVSTAADYFCLSPVDVRRHLPPFPAGSPPRDVPWRDPPQNGGDVGEVRRRGRRRLVNSSPFSSPCCGVRMAEIRAAWRIQSCGPRIVSDIVPTYVTVLS